MRRLMVHGAQVEFWMKTSVVGVDQALIQQSAQRAAASEQRLPKYDLFLFPANISRWVCVSVLRVSQAEGASGRGGWWLTVWASVCWCCCCGGIRCAFSVHLATSGNVEFDCGSGPDNQWETGGIHAKLCINDGQWHHVAVVRECTRSIRGNSGREESLCSSLSLRVYLRLMRTLHTHGV